ncbi:MAG TPA: isovaleryl-CoA dehydrogenase [Deltaproteobacteria bacterium]|nr:isovaleryl-CoA dehydrogenase [Deltaproteobacteria bacterium]
MPTHEVLNQPPPFENTNLFTSDAALQSSLVREGAGWAEDELSQFGELIGKSEIIRLGFEANQFPPVLKTHDRFGNRTDEVDFHPSWHALMKISIEHGLHAAPWATPKPGAHVARAAKVFLMAQVEYGHLCPVSMTYSVIPALRKQPDLAAVWEPFIVSNHYDPRMAPPAQKKGALLGMAMTEKQGGSDVRANTTQAVPAGSGGPGAEYLITGHKWFCSAPMNDAFLILAQAPGGLSCFLLPRWKPDGTRNVFRIQRLKDKLGNRSNASSEVEWENSSAWLVGEEGRGVPTIIEMVNHTRLDCVISSAGMMRQAFAQALHHSRHRSVFGRKLIEQPLMKNVLADLCLESEAATLLTMRLARAYDRPQEESDFRRLATALAKYWICKRASVHVGEALECLGGNGFVEESILPRLYRETPLNSIWEGSGNVICLDVLRAAMREPESLDAVLHEIHSAKEARLQRYCKGLVSDLQVLKTAEGEFFARRIVEKLALALQASLLLRHGRAPVAEAFLQSRLEGDRGLVLGTLAKTADFSNILEGKQ